MKHRWWVVGQPLTGVDVMLGTTAAQEVPTAIQLRLHGAQPLPFREERGGVAAVPLFAAAEVMLFRYEPLDPVGDVFLAHAGILRRKQIRPRRRSRGPDLP